MAIDNSAGPQAVARLRDFLLSKAFQGVGLSALAKQLPRRCLGISKSKLGIKSNAYHHCCFLFKRRPGLGVIYYHSNHHSLDSYSNIADMAALKPGDKFPEGVVFRCPSPT
jgi:hypothetical protein